MNFVVIQASSVKSDSKVGLQPINNSRPNRGFSLKSLNLFFDFFAIVRIISRLATKESAAWIVMCLSLSACNSLFYQPTTFQYHTPDQFGLVYDDVSLPNSDGLVLHGWVMKSSQAQKKLGSFLFFHGNGENLSSHFLMVLWLVDAGYSVLIFDYPGYGKSSGKSSPASTVDAGILFNSWMLKNMQPPYFWYAHSLGGIVALRAAEKIQAGQRPKTMVIHGSFSSYKSMAKDVVSRSWVTWLLQPIAWLLVSNSEAPKDLTSLSPTRVVVFHGDRDPVVPSRFGERIFSELAEPKSWNLLIGTNHNSGFFLEKGKYRPLFLQNL